MVLAFEVGAEVEVRTAQRGGKPLPIIGSRRHDPDTTRHKSPQPYLRIPSLEDFVTEVDWRLRETRVTRRHGREGRPRCRSSVTKYSSDRIRGHIILHSLVLLAVNYNRDSRILVPEEKRGEEGRGEQETDHVREIICWCGTWPGGCGWFDSVGRFLLGSDVRSVPFRRSDKVDHRSKHQFD